MEKEAWSVGGFQVLQIKKGRFNCFGYHGMSI
jgi:hypothetical protein